MAVRIQRRATPDACQRGAPPRSRETGVFSQDPELRRRAHVLRMDRIGNGGTKVRAIFVPRGHPMWVGSITTVNRRCESGRGETTMTRRESWAMLKTLQAFNERLEGPGLERARRRRTLKTQAKQ